MKSKQKAICEKLLLLPNKASVALRQGLRNNTIAQKVSALANNLAFLLLSFSFTFLPSVFIFALLYM